MALARSALELALLLSVGLALGWLIASLLRLFTRPTTYWRRWLRGWPEPAVILDRRGRTVAMSPAARTWLLQHGQPGEGAQAPDLESAIATGQRAQFHQQRVQFFDSQGEMGGRIWLSFRDSERQLLLRFKRLTLRRRPYALALLSERARHCDEVGQDGPDLAQRFVDTFEVGAIGLAHMSLSGHLLNVNPAFADFLGYSRAELVGRELHSITCPEEVPQDLRRFEALLCGQRSHYCADVRYLHRQGHRLWCRLTVTLVTAEPDYFIVAIEDINEEKRAQGELSASERKLRVMVEYWSEQALAWIAAPDLSRFHYLNAGVETILGRSRAELYDNPGLLRAQVHPEDRAAVLTGWGEHPSAEGWDLQYRVCRQDGSVRFVRDRGQTISDGEGETQYLVGMIQDVTEEVRRRDELQGSLRQLNRAYSELSESARIDPLTGLLNRQAFMMELRRESVRCQRHDCRAALVFIDLNDFKQVNDELGHGVGDRVLVQVAEHLRKSVRQSDLVGRFGGDEFLILLVNTDEAQGEQFCLGSLEPGVDLAIPGCDRSNLRLSWGVCELDGQAFSCDQALEIADQRMYRHKQRGKQGHSARTGDESRLASEAETAL